MNTVHVYFNAFRHMSTLHKWLWLVQVNIIHSGNLLSSFSTMHFYTLSVTESPVTWWSGTAVVVFWGFPTLFESMFFQPPKMLIWQEKKKCAKRGWKQCATQRIIKVYDNLYLIFVVLLYWHCIVLLPTVLFILQIKQFLIHLLVTYLA